LPRFPPAKIPPAVKPPIYSGSPPPPHPPPFPPPPPFWGNFQKIEKIPGQALPRSWPRGAQISFPIAPSVPPRASRAPPRGSKNPVPRPAKRNGLLMAAPEFPLPKTSPQRSSFLVTLVLVDGWPPKPPPRNWDFFFIPPGPGPKNAPSNQKKSQMGAPRSRLFFFFCCFTAFRIPPQGFLGPRPPTSCPLRPPARFRPPPPAPWPRAPFGGPPFFPQSPPPKRRPPPTRPTPGSLPLAVAKNLSKPAAGKDGPPKKSFCFFFWVPPSPPPSQSSFQEPMGWPPRMFSPVSG